MLYETLAAISHHDDLEKEWEEDILTPAGAPIDFTLATSIDLPRLEKLAKDALDRGRWVALLISRHISWLNESKRGELLELEQLLDEQLENQQRWQEELELTQDELDAAYAFMQWCDRLSLILGQQQLPDAKRFLEISQGPDGQRYDFMQYGNGLTTVKPWPFENDHFTVNIEACELHQVKFNSNSQLSQALQQALISVLEWTFAQK